MSEQFENILAPAKLLSWLLAAFAFVAVVVFCAGLYAVTTADVQGRRRELGIRVALGASPRNVAIAGVRRPVTMVLVGAFVGLVASQLVTMAIGASVFGVVVPGTVLWLTVPVITVAACACALWRPIRLACRVDPRDLM